ncbi:uncharacterized protein LOC122858824 isoform X2 [Aphidius gifuensis]|nr:uncharacterized protein LOC122858824 isoform X2 [Aphidius gifuensis]
MNNIFIYLHIIVLIICLSKSEEIWEQDLSNEFNIGASTDGYDKVGLKCGAESMKIELKTTDDFTGVIYTQGSFHSKKSPCFLDPKTGRSFTMDIPLHNCETEKDGDKYSNVLVIQHDDELVTPGDAAFNLECDFSQPREHTVSAEVNTTKKRRARSSSIALVDADPGRDRKKRAAFIQSYSDEVIFTPNFHR